MNLNLKYQSNINIIKYLFFFFIIVNSTYGFSNSYSDAELLVNEGKYQEAFDILTDLNLNTPEAYYLKGLCMYYMNKNPYEAIVILSKALAADGPLRIKFVLGLIYHRQYKISDALRMFNEYMSLTRSQEEKQLTLKYKEYCNNISAVAHRGKISDIRGVTNILKKDIAVQYNQQDIKGVIVPKSYNLYSKTDEKNNSENLLMILPKDAEKINYVYYAAYEPGRPDHSDIFRVKVLENGEFSAPENLGSTINTRDDEMYPYFDDENQVLYFASKGHQSIGGFDVFMSYYNAGAESWSKPINIGLPVNSPDDDYLYIPLEGENEYIFLTNRKTSYDKADMVKLYIAPGAGYKTLVNPDEIMAFNSLEEAKESRLAFSNEQPGEVDAKNDPAYQLLMEKALNYQVKADSVKRRIYEQQQKIDVALGESRKIQLQADLKIMHEEYRKLQEQSDVHYSAVREWEKRNNITSSEMPVRQEEINEQEEMNDNTKEYEDNTETRLVMQQEEKPIQMAENNINQAQAKNVIVPENKIYKTADDLPDGILFTVQIGVFSKKVEKDNFAGLDQVFYYYLPDRNLYKYFTGVYNNMDDARAHVSKAKGAGFPDAFIAAFNSRQPVSVSKAQEILGNK